MGLGAMPLPVEEPLDGESLLPRWVLAGAVVGVVLGAGGQETGGLLARQRKRDGVVSLEVEGLGGGVVERERKAAGGRQVGSSKRRRYGGGVLGVGAEDEGEGAEERDGEQLHQRGWGGR